MSPRMMRCFAAAGAAAVAAVTFMGLCADATSVRSIATHRSSGGNLRQQHFSPSSLLQSTVPEGAVKAEAATAFCLGAIKEIREKYNLGTLSKADEDGENGAIIAVKAAAVTPAAVQDVDTENTCPNAGESTPAVVAVAGDDSQSKLSFVLPIDLAQVIDGETEDEKMAICKKILTAEYTSGLEELNQLPELKPDQPYIAGQDPFKKRALQNLPILLHAESKTIACAWTQKCSTGKNLLLCTLDPTLNNSTNPAFSPAVYDALFPKSSASGLSATVAAAFLTFAAVVFV